MQNNNPLSNSTACWAVIPAAGRGARMGGDTPKQYLSIAGKTLLAHSLDRLLDCAEIAGGVVALAAGDDFWPALEYQSAKPVWEAIGGEERSHTVLSALHTLTAHAAEQDWVLVHDAARPCVRQADILKLITQCQIHNTGGLLAVPVRDTLKRQGGDSALPQVATTVNRTHLWQAQTPQMFRLGELRQALQDALKAGVEITDEASAMEWAGHQPLLVAGHADNLKVTTAEDLLLAEIILGLRT